MRVILWLVVAVFLLFSGYWFVGARATRAGVETALAAMKADGRADYSDLSVGGFPGRFDVTLSGPRLADPARGLGWSAPFIQVFALSYNPGHIIAVWPHTQTVTLGPATAVVESADMRASAKVGVTPALPFRNLIFVATAPKVSTDLADIAVTAGEARLAVREADGGAPTYELGAVLSDVTASGADLPPETDPSPANLRVDALATLSAPLDRTAGAVPPRLTALSLTDLHFGWGKIDLRGKGDLTVSPEGRPEGRIDLTVADWREALRQAVTLGLVAREVQPTWDRLLGMMARGGADPETLSVPLDFRSGLMFLGPLPLGAAPVLAP